MTLGILFVIGFAVAALVFAGIVVARVLKKEKNSISVPLKPKGSYRAAILISLLIGIIVAVVIYFAGMT